MGTNSHPKKLKKLLSDDVYAVVAIVVWSGAGILAMLAVVGSAGFS